MKNIKPRKIIRWPIVKMKLGGKHAPSKVTVWRWERDGRFPKRVALGPNSMGWFKDEIDQWFDDRATAR